MEHCLQTILKTIPSFSKSLWDKINDTLLITRSDIETQQVHNMREENNMDQT